MPPAVRYPFHIQDTLRTAASSGITLKVETPQAGKRDRAKINDKENGRTASIKIE